MRLWLKVLVDDLAADPKFPGEDCFCRLAGSSTLVERGSLLGLQHLTPALIDAGLFGQGDTFAMSFPEEGSFELGERTHHAALFPGGYGDAHEGFLRAAMSGSSLSTNH